MVDRSRVTVVGIPARDEARTVGAVAQAADAGPHLAFVTFRSQTVPDV